jgi:hypothetical protein
VTREQQKRLNAMCGDLCVQITLCADGRYRHVNEVRGREEFRRIGKDDWRWIFCGTYKGWKTVPAIEGAGFVMLGASSRDLTVAEAGEVMEMISAFGAERGVIWTDPQTASYEAAA